MILTVTPNPSLDRAYEVPPLVRGRVLRADGERVDPGGKGVNVSRAVAAAGVRTTAVLPLGGAPGVLLAELLGAQGVDVTAVSIAGRTRSNIALTEPDGTLTKVDSPGPALSPEESALLLDTVRSAAAEAAWVACCGSLPRGIGPRWYADLVAQVHAAGARVALDAPGPALPEAPAARPELITSDASALAAAVGRPLPTLGDVIKAAEELRERGAGAVLASLGRDGRLLVSAEGTCYGTAPVPAVRSSVGADDASLAGFLIAGGTGPGALASALAHGAAAAQLPGSAMPTPADLRPDRVRITEDPPLDLQLADPGMP
ncbi:1-phosphofructokinase family hexose kinase [Streptomyces xanthophaeus]|uniref:1-phosphofructokinase family hexose kinase n=1 Tax=Streptomyces xanthophaeus TaxID=67385 RepID=UPI002649E339|nr:1-phosphofructokinase family hexose kinase [Streptomyces xanthophaeus]WKD34230.1 1-phosphofructokinase family hexose kinase [Streptomyces xanthophaeus]